MVDFTKLVPQGIAKPQSLVKAQQSIPSPTQPIGQRSGFNAEEIAFLKKAKQQGFSKEEAVASIDRRRAGQIKPKATETAPKPSFLGAVKGFAEERGAKSIQAQQAKQTVAETGVQMAGQGAGLVGDVLGEVMVRGAESVRKVIPKYIKQPITDTLKKQLESPEMVLGVKAMTKGIGEYNERAKKNPRAARNAGAIFNIGELAADLYTGGGAGKLARKGTGELASGAVKATQAVTKPIGKGAESLTTGVLGLTTGTSQDTIRQALKSAGTPEFTDALRGSIDETDTLEKVKTAVNNIREDRSTLYGADYDKLLEVETPVDITDVKKSLIEEVFGPKGLRVAQSTDEAGNVTLDFAKSTISNRSGQKNVVQDIVQDIMSREDFTPAGLDILKKRVGDYYRNTAEFAKTDRIVSKITDAISGKITREVPEYASMNKKYSELTNLLKDIEGATAVGGKKAVTTAVTKLKGALRRNQEFRQQMLKELNRYAEGDILGELAGSALSESMPRGLMGVIAGGAVGGAALTGGLGMLLNPNFLVGLGLTSPRVVGELANVVGISTKKLKSIISKAKEQVKSIDNTLQTKGGYDLPFDISTAIDSIRSVDSNDTDER